MAVVILPGLCVDCQIRQPAVSQTALVSGSVWRPLVSVDNVALGIDRQ